METAKLFPGKPFVSTILQSLEYKSEMTGATKRRYLMRAAMAGIIIGLMYVGHYTIDAGFETVLRGPDNPDGLLGLGKVVAALFFGFALVFIYFSKSELLTSNMMIVSVGWYFRRISFGRGMRVMSLCYLGNLLGGLFVAVLLWASSILSDSTMAIIGHSVDAKLAYITDGSSGWVDLFVRAIFCNFFINLAMLMVYSGNIKEDLTKVIVMIISVFVFAYLGFEHSVANTVLFLIDGFQDGIAVGPAIGNVVIALIGNFVGGGLLIGLYYAYLNDEDGFTRRHPDRVAKQGGQS